MTDRGMVRRLWIKALRAPFIVASFLPMGAAALLARWETGRLDLPLLGLTALGLGAIHLGTNMINDNFDFRSGADTAVTHRNPFAGGGRVLTQGVLGLGTHLAVATSLVLVGIAVGLYLSWLVGPLVLVLGLAGVVLGVFYVVPPLRIAHHGVGEAAVAVAFGPTIVLGTYVVQVGHVSPAALLLSIPFGLLVCAILWINELPDVEADEAVGKRTLVVRLGRPRSVQVYGGMVLGALGVATAAATVGLLPRPFLLTLLSLPLALRALRTARRHSDDPMGLIPANAGTILLLLVFGGLGIGGLALGLVQGV